MAEDGGKSSSPSLDSVRLPPTLQKKLSAVIGTSETDRRRSPLDCNLLSGSSKTKCITKLSSRVGGKEVCSETRAKREGVLFKGISSTKEVRGLEVSDRFVKAKRISNPSDFSDGHIGKGEEGATARDVGDVHRPVRCLSSHPNEGILPMLSVFSGGVSAVQVSGSTFRPNARSVALHGSGETVKKVGSSALFNSVSVPGRLAKSTQVKGDTTVYHRSSSSTVSKVRSACKCKKVRTSSNTAGGVSGRTTKPTGRSCISHRRETESSAGSGKDMSESEQDISAHWGVIGGIHGIRFPHNPLGTVILPKTSTTGPKGSEERETHTNPMVQIPGSLQLHLRFWLDPRTWKTGVPFQRPPPQITIFTDASLEGWG